MSVIWHYIWKEKTGSTPETNALCTTTHTVTGLAVRLNHLPTLFSYHLLLLAVLLLVRVLTLMHPLNVALSMSSVVRKERLLRYNVEDGGLLPLLVGVLLAAKYHKKQ